MSTGIACEYNAGIIRCWQPCQNKKVWLRIMPVNIFSESPAPLQCPPNAVAQTHSACGGTAASLPQSHQFCLWGKRWGSWVPLQIFLCVAIQQEPIFVLTCNRILVCLSFFSLAISSVTSRMVAAICFANLIPLWLSGALHRKRLRGYVGAPSAHCVSGLQVSSCPVHSPRAPECYTHLWYSGFFFSPHPRLCSLILKRGRWRGEREWEKKRDRKTSVWQKDIDRLPPYMPQLGIEPTVFWRMGWPSNQMSYVTGATFDIILRLNFRKYFRRIPESLNCCFITGIVSLSVISWHVPGTKKKGQIQSSRPGKAGLLDWPSLMGGFGNCGSDLSAFIRCSYWYHLNLTQKSGWQRCPL